MKAHGKYIALAALMATSFLTCSAMKLSPSEALDRALGEYGIVGTMSPAGCASEQMKLVSTVNDKTETPVAYVFVPVSGRGFVVAAADNDIRAALLGYSDSSTVDGDNIPQAMKAWLQGFSVSSSGNQKLAEADSRENIEPILTTVWGQGTPYNDRCPTIDGVHAPCGCVATAIGQCMKSVGWPAKGKGKASYRWDGKTLELDFDTISFDWDQMIDNYSNGAGTAMQRAEVAKLLYSLGVSVRMSYNLTGSGSNLMTAATALIDHFDYAESVCYYEREYYTEEEWTDMIYAELAEGRPVPYTGSGDVDGHAFVIDGYRQGGYFHMNWGHEGGSDGYFLLNNLDPWERGSYASGYNENQTMLIGLRPSTDVVEPATSLRLSGDFVTVNPGYNRAEGQNVIFRGENGIFSMAASTIKVNLGVKIVDRKGNVSYVADPDTVKFVHFSARQTFSIPTTSFPARGTFEVTPAYRTIDGQWHDVQVALDHNGARRLVANSSRLVFSASGDTSKIEVKEIDLRTPIHIGQEWSLTGTFANSGAEFLGEIWPVLLRNDSVVAHGPGIDLNLLTDSIMTMEWTGTFTVIGSKKITAGEYGLGFARSEDYAYAVIDSESVIDVTVQDRSVVEVEAVASIVELGGYRGKTSASSPAYLSALDYVPITFSVSCEQGYFGQEVTAHISSADLSRTYVISRPTFVGLDEGKSADVTVEADLRLLWESAVFAVLPWASTSGQLGEEPAYFRIGVSGIEEIKPADASGIYPNPAWESVTLRHTEPIHKVEVFDMSGMPMSVDATVYDNHAQLNVGRLRHGIYMVRVNGSATYRMLK